MDKLAQRLHDDAGKIEVTLSDELDRRIAASLLAISPEPEAPRAKPLRPLSTWWASSITGVAAVVAVIAVINSEPEPVSITEPPAPTLALPFVDWHPKPAVMLGPLQQEYEDLQADLKKAEKALKRDIGI
jgi:hypothetical protein